MAGKILGDWGRKLGKMVTLVKFCVIRKIFCQIFVNFALGTFMVPLLPVNPENPDKRSGNPIQS